MSTLKNVDYSQFDESQRLAIHFLTYQEKAKSKLTVKNYLTYIKSYNIWLKAEGHLPPQTGDTPLEIVAKASAIYVQQINNSKDVAPSTANRREIDLKGFLKFLTEHEYIAVESVPQEGLKTKKIQGGAQANVKWLKEDDVKRIYEAIESQLRVSALCDIRVGDIDIKKGVFSVREGKGGKYRDVPLGDKTIGLIKLWLECREEYTEDSHLFVTQRADFITERTVQHITKRQVVADLAGHSNINTTRIYIKPSKEELKKYVNVVEL